MGITLKQIADLAGVHKSTVDKVIHNRPGVSEKKRQQIRRLLDTYGYDPNPLAKALNYQKKKMTVAVVIPAVDAMPLLRKGIELVRQDFNSFNIEVAYYQTNTAEEQAQLLQQLSTETVSGIMLVPMEHPAVEQAMDQLARTQIPVVTANSDIDAPRLCYVGQNMVQSGQVAARLFHLFLPNGGKLAVISSQNMRAVEQRERAFLEYLPRCGNTELSVCETVYIQETPEDAQQKTRALLQRQPDLDALFITCGNVVDICQVLREQNRPLTVICYETYPAIVELVQRGEIVCTLDGSLTNQGRLAMRLLFEYLIYEKQPEQPIFYTKNEILLQENISAIPL